MKVLLQTLGLGAAAVAVFWLVFYLTFPSASASDRIAYEFQERMDLIVDVDKPKPKGIGGVRFKALQIGKMPRKGDEPRTLLSMGRTWVKVKPIKALRGIYDAKFDGVLFDGNARGTLAYSETAIAADVTLDELKVSAFPLQGATWSIDGGGTLDGRIDLQVDQEDVTQSEGQISFDFDGLTFLEGSQIYGMDFETLFEEAGGRITVDNGRGTVDKARFKGDKLDAEVSGYVSLKKDLMKSRLALKIKFKLLDESLDGLLALQMGANPSHKDDKGYYHYLISGPIERPKPREDRAAARRANRSKGKRTEDEADEPEGDDPKERSGRRAKRLDEMTDEERAEWEKERDERREALRKKRDERRKEMQEGGGASRERGEREVHTKDEEFSEDLRVGGTHRRDEMAIDGPETDDSEEFEDDEGRGDTDDRDEPPAGEFEGGGEEY